MTLTLFENQKYLNIETFRKNGKGVRTPVWFTQDGDALLIWTQADSGKAKRIRRDGSVRIAPSTGAGEPLGDWIPARAQVDESPEAIRHIRQLMSRKYGFMFSLFGLLGKMRKATYTAIKIQVN
jgi:uncharacterized protein